MNAKTFSHTNFYTLEIDMDPHTTEYLSKS